MNFFKKLFSRKEKDLVLGNPSEEVETEVEMDWYQQRQEARADIDSAIAAFTFIEEQDADSPDIINWGMKRKVKRCKRQCLEIICSAINDLTYEQDNEEDD